MWQDSDFSFTWKKFFWCPASFLCMVNLSQLLLPSRILSYFFILNTFKSNIFVYCYLLSDIRSTWPPDVECTSSHPKYIHFIQDQILGNLCKIFSVFSLSYNWFNLQYTWTSKKLINHLYFNKNFKNKWLTKNFTKINMRSSQTSPKKKIKRKEH